MSFYIPIINPVARGFRKIDFLYYVKFELSSPLKINCCTNIFYKNH